MSAILEALAGTESPWVVFSAVRAEVEEIDALPGWKGITGANTSKEFEAAVVAFNKGELDGLALTYARGATGIRLPMAKTLAMIGSAPANLMAQAAHRAPGAKVVLL